MDWISKFDNEIEGIADFAILQWINMMAMIRA